MAARVEFQAAIVCTDHVARSREEIRILGHYERSKLKDSSMTASFLHIQNDGSTPDTNA